MAFQASINGHRVEMDSPEAGEGSGPSPKRLMLASLAGCTGVDIVSILTKMKVVFSDLEIRVEGELSEEHPKIYKNVIIVYSVKMQETDRNKMEKAVKLSQEKYCGVFAMFKAFATIETRIIYL